MEEMEPELRRRIRLNNNEFDQGHGTTTQLAPMKQACARWIRILYVK